MAKETKEIQVGCVSVWQEIPGHRIYFSARFESMT